MAGTAFADHCERCSHRCLHHLNLGLKLHGLGQQRLQHGHIHHPIELTHTLLAGSKVELAAIVAPHLHLVHRRDGGGLRPAAQVLQQGHGRAVERISAHIRGGCGGGDVDQGHVQPLTGQQQSQSAAHDASAADANVRWKSHARIVRRRPMALGSRGLWGRAGGIGLSR